jgi:HSP20 family protein
MKLARYNAVPSAALSPLEGFFRHPFPGLTAFDELFGLGTFPGFSAPKGLAADVYEDEGHYFARFEAPGVKKEDVKIELNDRRLVVAVSRKTAGADAETAAKLSRSLSVPEGIAVEGITAKLEDGLLTVTLPKAEQRKPRVIEVN